MSDIGPLFGYSELGCNCFKGLPRPPMEPIPAVTNQRSDDRDGGRRKLGSDTDTQRLTILLTKGSAVSDIPICDMIEFQPNQIYLAGKSPRPILLTICDQGSRKKAARQVFRALIKDGIFATCCRGVRLDCLSCILMNGCDVSPTNSPIFADDMDKAIEYGGADQVIQIFDPKLLKRSWTEVRSDEDASRIESLKRYYKSWETSQDGSHIWFSMFAFESRYRTSAYEVDYGWFIPDDAQKALTAIAIFVETRASADRTIALIEAHSKSLPDYRLSSAIN